MQELNLLQGKLEAQAESLIGEMHVKEMDLERLNGLWRRVESGNVEVNTARNRFGRCTSEIILLSNLCITDLKVGRKYSCYSGRILYVLCIFALHILVFIKI
ncbi:hypothetical protein F2P56_021130 [Juglans regia]|uniref:Uncharacterized protein n=1 Tax=Juglans regia TaxID=51240 RepID=A0A833UQN7_JUGRE|nr:hypothetical protein F2P56_021130 [Juglans regia]